MLNFASVTPFTLPFSQKTANFRPETASFDVFCVKIRWGVLLAVRDFLNPKNTRVNNLVREIAHARKQNPLCDLD